MEDESQETDLQDADDATARRASVRFTRVRSAGGGPAARAPSRPRPTLRGETMTDPIDEAELNARHKARMAKLKPARDRMVAERQVEKGLLIVHTGAGKGKTTAALGMVCRMIG